MPLIPEDQFRERVVHAKTCERGLNAEEAASYKDPINIIAYIAEELGQCLVVLNMQIISDDVRQQIKLRLKFYAGVLGRVAELKGAVAPSIYASFNTEGDNQIDRFLKEIGFLTEDVLKK